MQPCGLESSASSAGKFWYHNGDREKASNGQGIIIMRIVFTGAAGFLGSHLVDSLVESGNEVIGVDNMLTGQPENLGHLENSRLFRLNRADATQNIHVPGPIDRIYGSSAGGKLLGQR
jgi:hypothetical protein